MFEKLKSFISAHGFKIMMTGFGLFTAGIIIYIQSSGKNPELHRISFWITVAGIGCYVVGRIGVVLQRRTERRERQEEMRKAMNKDQT